MKTKTLICGIMSIALLGGQPLLARGGGGGGGRGGHGGGRSSSGSAERGNGSGSGKSQRGDKCQGKSCDKDQNQEKQQKKLQNRKRLQKGKGADQGDKLGVHAKNELNKNLDAGGDLKKKTRTAKAAAKVLK